MEFPCIKLCKTIGKRRDSVSNVHWTHQHKHSSQCKYYFRVVCIFVFFFPKKKNPDCAHCIRIFDQHYSYAIQPTHPLTHIYSICSIMYRKWHTAEQQRERRRDYLDFQSDKKILCWHSATSCFMRTQIVYFIRRSQLNKNWNEAENDAEGNDWIGSINFGILLENELIEFVVNWMEKHICKSSLTEITYYSHLWVLNIPLHLHRLYRYVYGVSSVDEFTSRFAFQHWTFCSPFMSIIIIFVWLSVFIILSSKFRSHSIEIISCSIAVDKFPYSLKLVDNRISSFYSRRRRHWNYEVHILFFLYNLWLKIDSYVYVLCVFVFAHVLFQTPSSHGIHKNFFWLRVLSQQSPWMVDCVWTCEQYLHEFDLLREVTSHHAAYTLHIDGWMEWIIWYRHIAAASIL